MCSNSPADNIAATAASAAADRARSTALDGDASIIGVVRYLLNPDRRSCEFAIAIADEVQRQGLDTKLMNAIIEQAHDRGLERIEGFVLAANAPMMRLMQALGFSVHTDRDDPALKRVWRDLGTDAA